MVPLKRINIMAKKYLDSNGLSYFWRQLLNFIGTHFKTKQTAVSDPSADGTGVTFIDSISQNTNGVITPHKKTVQTMGASGSNHAAGLVPDPGATAGSTKFLREDGTWQVPAGGGGGGSTYTAGAGIDITNDVISRAMTTTTNTSATPSLAIAGNEIIKLTSNALTAITVSSVADNDLESLVYFTTPATVPTLTLPNDVEVYGNDNLLASTSYVMAFRNKKAVIAPEDGLSVAWSKITGKPTFGPDARMANDTVSTLTGTHTLSLEDQRHYNKYTTTASSLNLTLNSNVNIEHYIMIANTGSSECTVTLAAVQFGGSSVSNVYVPEDAIKIAAGKAIEIGFYANASFAVVTCSQTLTA